MLHVQNDERKRRWITDEEKLKWKMATIFLIIITKLQRFKCLLDIKLHVSNQKKEDFYKHTNTHTHQMRVVHSVLVFFSTLLVNQSMYIIIQKKNKFFWRFSIIEYWETNQKQSFKLSQLKQNYILSKRSFNFFNP